MEDGNGTMMDYQVLTVDDYLLLKQSAFSLTEENICWSCFFAMKLSVWSRRIIFFLSASYEGSYWICWIVMLWCIYTNSNKFLIIVIQLKLIEKHWIMFNNLLTISSQLQEGGSLGGSVMEDYSPHGRDSRLTFFTRILYSVLFFYKAHVRLNISFVHVNTVFASSNIRATMCKCIDKLREALLSEKCSFFEHCSNGLWPPPFYLNICPILQGVFFYSVFVV